MWYNIFKHKREVMKGRVLKMAMPLSEEIRNTIIIHKMNGESNADIANWLLITKRSVSRIWKLYQEQNSIAPKPHNKGRRAAFCEKKMDLIAAKVIEQPDITLGELKEEFNLKITISALCRKLKKRNLNFKKNIIS